MRRLTSSYFRSLVHQKYETEHCRRPPVHSSVITMQRRMQDQIRGGAPQPKAPPTPWPRPYAHLRSPEPSKFLASPARAKFGKTINLFNSRASLTELKTRGSDRPSIYGCGGRSRAGRSVFICNAASVGYVWMAALESD